MVCRNRKPIEERGGLILSLFSKIFGRDKRPDTPMDGYFQTLTVYAPIFTSFNGSIYESQLVRSAIHAKAKHISKLQVEVVGSAKPKLTTKLKTSPNEFQTWGQFMYRLSTILDMQNTAFIVPILDRYEEISGIYPILPSMCEIVEYGGQPWLRYSFLNGETASIEMNRCGIMNKFQYEDDFFGEDNLALLPTMDLIEVQNQGIQEAVKSSATFRFMARLDNFAKAEDLAKERKRFNAENFKSDGTGGILLFPNTYSDIRQINSKPYVVDSAQMSAIKENVSDYFGVNADILQNKAYGDAWTAFYEGEIEPFAIQFSEVTTKMLYTERERASGAEIMATSSRLQYMSNQDKMNLSAQSLDRGFLNRNEVREMWGLPPLPDGDSYTIRGEYYFLQGGVKDAEPTGQDE